MDQRWQITDVSAIMQKKVKEIAECDMRSSARCIEFKEITIKM